ncbi:MAG: hypothetical protein ACK5Q5_24130, partial [Planctomycetaceae bacterium]
MSLPTSGFWGDGFDLLGVDPDFGEAFAVGLLVGLRSLRVAAGVVRLAVGLGLVEPQTDAGRQAQGRDHDAGCAADLF